MKLSQVLKDWPEKKNYDLSWVGAGAIDIAEMRGEMAGHNHALTSCDREIDREALAEALFMVVKNHDNEKTSVSDDIKDFISTMTSWLKPTEGK